MNTSNETAVLICLPTGRDAALVSRVLASAGLTAVCFETIPQLLEAARSGAAALIIGGEATRDAEFEGLLSFLRQQEEWSDLPVLLVAEGDPAEQPATGLADRSSVVVVSRPLSIRTVLSLVGSMTRARARQYELRSHLTEMREARKILEHRTRLQEELLGLVSHELRTPLTTIVGMSDILLRRFDGLSDQDRREALQTIHDDGERLQRLIENLLVLSKASAEPEVTTEPVLLQRLIPRITDGLTAKLALRADIDLPIGLPAAFANPAFIELIFSNLLHNARKYADASQPVTIRAHSNANCVCVVVEDRGAQLDATEFARLTEPFYRAEAALSKPGMGLGMAVCKRLMEAQRGVVTLSARPGGGLRVELRLDRADSSTQSSDQAPVFSEAPATGPAAGSYVLGFDRS